MARKKYDKAIRAGRKLARVDYRAVVALGWSPEFAYVFDQRGAHRPEPVGARRYDYPEFVLKDRYVSPFTIKIAQLAVDVFKAFDTSRPKKPRRQIPKK